MWFSGSELLVKLIFCTLVMVCGFYGLWSYTPYRCYGFSMDFMDQLVWNLAFFFYSSILAFQLFAYIVAFWYCDLYRPFGTAVVIYITNETCL